MCPGVQAQQTMHVRLEKEASPSQCSPGGQRPFNQLPVSLLKKNKNQLPVSCARTRLFFSCECSMERERQGEGAAWPHDRGWFTCAGERIGILGRRHGWYPFVHGPTFWSNARRGSIGLVPMYQESSLSTSQLSELSTPSGITTHGTRTSGLV